MGISCINNSELKTNVEVEEKPREENGNENKFTAINEIEPKQRSCGCRSPILDGLKKARQRGLLVRIKKYQKILNLKVV